MAVLQRGAQSASNGAYGYAARGVRVGEALAQGMEYQGASAVRAVTGMQKIRETGVLYDILCPASSTCTSTFVVLVRARAFCNCQPHARRPATFERTAWKVLMCVH